MFEKRKAKKEQKQFDQELSLGVGLGVERYARASVQHFSGYSELKKLAQSKSIQTMPRLIFSNRQDLQRKPSM